MLEKMRPLSTDFQQYGWDLVEHDGLLMLDPAAVTQKWSTDYAEFEGLKLPDGTAQGPVKAVRASAGEIYEGTMKGEAIHGFHRAIISSNVFFYLFKKNQSLARFSFS